MPKNRICVIGNMDSGLLCEGQTVKTVETARLLAETFGEENVKRLSYHKVKDSRVGTMRLLLRAFFGAEHIVLVVFSALVKTLVRVCVSLNRVFHRKLYYVLIGGSLGKMMRSSPKVAETLNAMDGIFVESGSLADELTAAGVRGVRQMSNFKHMRKFTEDDLDVQSDPPYKLIYFSRISERKGFVEMLDVVRAVNADKVRYTLDIYGYVDPDFAARYAELEKDFPPEVRYMGVADAWSTTETIHGYFAQLFPTKCPTEGHPGSIIDSFYAGVPVIVSEWNFRRDMIREGETGLVFPMGDFDAMKRLLLKVYDDPSVVERMRPLCLAEAEKYEPAAAGKPLIDLIRAKSEH